MPRIKLGRNGDQPFTIAPAKLTVSNVHAYLDWTPETGEIWLEDNNSTNGTFIRNEEGEFVPIVRERITPDTFICLGADTALGCSFFAHQAIDEVSEVYYNDFMYIYKKGKEYDARLEKLETMTKWIRISLQITVPILAMFLLTTFFPKIAAEYRIVASMATPVVLQLIDFPGKRKRIKEERNRWRRCPNPQCCHTLSDEEVHSLHCRACRAQ